MHRRSSLVLALVLSALAVASAAEPEAGSPAKLGAVKVGEYPGQVLFQFPADDGRSYRVDLAISKPNDTPPIDSGRVEVWLLTRGGRSLPATLQPAPGPLIEANSGGTTANAVYFFPPGAPRKDLVGVAIAVDGILTAFKIPSPDVEGA